MNLRLSPAEVQHRALALATQHLYALNQRTDRTFAVLMGLQWLGGIAVALLVSPQSWQGMTSAVPVHVWAAMTLGLLFQSLPVALAVLRPGRRSTRVAIAVGQALMSGLLIHLTGGRIETHFHIFGSLALLAFYRDWRVLVLFSGWVALDHLVRGLWWPESIFGTPGIETWRWLEHAGWVVFEDLFLILSCVQGQKDLRASAQREAWLELSRHMVETRVVKPLVGSAATLKDSVRTLSGSTEEQRQTLSRQAQALHETRETAEEIRRTSLAASEHARRVLASTETADAVGQQTEAAISRSLEGLSAIQTQVEAISTLIHGLEAHTAQIAGITETVKDLADQSNVLAVNAAIEAARVGEEGRGFAVVAQEIRNLASQSVQATGQVSSVLEDTRRGIQEVVALTRRGSDRMARDMEAVRSSGEGLRTLSGMVRGNSDAVRQIAATVNQQSAGVSQIFSAVTDLTALMQAALERVDATNTAAGTLQSVTEQVHGVIDAYQEQA
jgi:methyl-accepting chemotaxis protein